MMKILALDSSAKSASVALSEDDILLSEFYMDTNFTHSQTLMPMIESLYKNVGIEPEKTDLFSCTVGPGSFTGVRIGVSTVKGMAFALGKPCFAVSSLEAMAYNFVDTESIICAVMDARRNQVYNSIFEARDAKIYRFCEDRAISVDDLLHELYEKYSQKNIILVGNGSDLCYNSQGRVKSNIKIASMHLKYCHAYGVILATIAKLKTESPVSSVKLNPTYLRMSQAQRNLENRLK